MSILSPTYAEWEEVYKKSPLLATNWANLIQQPYWPILYRLIN